MPVVIFGYFCRFCCWWEISVSTCLVQTLSQLWVLLVLLFRVIILVIVQCNFAHSYMFLLFVRDYVILVEPDTLLDFGMKNNVALIYCFSQKLHIWLAMVNIRWLWVANNIRSFSITSCDLLYEITCFILRVQWTVNILSSIALMFWLLT